MQTRTNGIHLHGVIFAMTRLFAVALWLTCRMASAQSPTTKPAIHRANGSIQATSAPTQMTINAVQQHLQAVLQKEHIPGLAVAIVRGDKVLLAKGLGFRDLAKKLPVTTKSLFAIGSTTKAMTAAALGLLVERKQVRWETPIRKYLPTWQLQDKVASQEMTAIDLLTHRSGLPRHDLVWYGSQRKRQQIVESLRHLPSSKSFRAHFQYNNLMYLVAGELIKQQSKSPWETFVKEQLFRPLGMNDALFSVRQLQQSKDVALPYVVAGGKTRRVPFRNIDAIGPAGSVNAHIEDMARWTQWHLNKGKVGDKQLLKPSTMRKLHTPQVVMNIPRMALLTQTPHLGHVTYALGWIHTRFRDRQLLFHTGSIDGYTALVSLMPKENLGFVLLTNKGKNPILIHLMLECYERLLGFHPIDRIGPHRKLLAQKQHSAMQRLLAYRKQWKPNTKPARPLTAYTGEYRHPAYGRLLLTASPTQLKMNYHTLSFAFAPTDGDVFQAVDRLGLPISQKFKIRFKLSPKGQIKELLAPWQAGVPDIAFRKVPTPITAQAKPGTILPKPAVLRARATAKPSIVKVKPAAAQARPAAREAVPEANQYTTPAPSTTSEEPSEPPPVRAAPTTDKPGQLKRLRLPPTLRRDPAPAATRPAPRRVAQPLAARPAPRPYVEPPPIRHKAPSYRKITYFAYAIAEAKRLKRPIFLDLFAEWCGPCKKLEAETFSHPLVYPLLDKYLVVRFDVDQAEGKALVKRFNVTHFPTTLMLASDGKEVERVIGYYAARYFRAPIKAALYKRYTFQQLQDAAKLRPNDRKIQLLLADRLVLRRQVDEARTIYTALWNGDPKNHHKVGAWALFGIARSYTRSGMYTFAIPWLQQFQQQFPFPTPAQIEAYRLLLYTYEKTRQPDEHTSLLKDFRARFSGKHHEFK